MPTYEYACQSCGRHFEVFQRFSENALTTCDVCGGPLRKVFHPAGILFKGSGFYATDSRRKSSTSTRDSGKEKKESGTPAKAESKGDSGGSSSSSSSSSDSSSSGSGSGSGSDSSGSSGSSGSAGSQEKSA